MPEEKQSINFFFDKDEFSFISDTIIDKNSSSGDTLIHGMSEKDTIKQKDTTSKLKTDFNQQKIDSILRVSEERIRQIEQQRQQAIELQQKKIYKPKTDTARILYREFGVANFPVKERLENDPFNQNIFLNFKSIKPKQDKEIKSVFIEESPGKTDNIKNYTETIGEKNVKPSPTEIKTQFDWITILLMVSFVLFGWLRLFHKKYLLSLLKSTISYKEAYSLYRDKNSLMQRASFVGNLLFVSNLSLFAVLISNFFHLQWVDVAEYELYLIVFACLTGLYIFRAITSGFVGLVFLKQQVFSEYFHHINLYTKIMGLFLFPVVIALRFLTYDFIDFIIYIGFGIVLILYVFQLLRSFQIINRKNLSIFYMILYLCAFEFAPFLILYKMFLTLIS
ncbi:MAG TPA: DUF4271 domain-containing protein [Bacteroidales bacterium]|nr:DUF4271 domain-containing protein [Bacteroidales bacterium]